MSRAGYLSSLLVPENCAWLRHSTSDAVAYRNAAFGRGPLERRDMVLCRNKQQLTNKFELMMMMGNLLPHRPFRGNSGDIEVVNTTPA